MEPLRNAPPAQSFSAARTVRAESDDVHMSQKSELPEDAWRVPEQVTIHVLESPDELADFLTAIHIREIAESSAHKIAGILRLIGAPVTVICEYEYADALYRDTFYACFSRKFSIFPRDCKRLSFFQGELNPTDFYQYAPETERLLQERFVGICVLKPIRYGEIGRTVLDPLKLKIPVCYVKTARFRMDVLGHALFVDGYPYSSQDTETMTCAEITIWSIMEYFGVTFPEYGTVLPSQITAGLDKLSSERTLPSRASEYTKSKTPSEVDYWDLFIVAFLAAAFRGNGDLVRSLFSTITHWRDIHWTSQPSYYRMLNGHFKIAVPLWEQMKDSAIYSPDEKKTVERYILSMDRATILHAKENGHMEAFKPYFDVSDENCYYPLIYGEIVKGDERDPERVCEFINERIGEP